MAQKKLEPVDLSDFRRIRKAGCSFAQIDLKPEHADALRGAMQAPDISNAGIHDWMRSKGYDIGRESIAKHRAGRCICRALTN